MTPRPKESSVSVILRVLDVGDLVRAEYAGSLHAFADEHERRGIQRPPGLWYLGPVSRGLREPVDETRLEVYFDASQTTLEEVSRFLKNCGIRVAPPSSLIPT